ncbi:MAG: hypothetical protein ABSA40_07170 [Candidatus Dormibacteria bacterium]
MAAFPPSQAEPVVARIRHLLAELGAPLLVAVDGQSGAGKARLASEVATAVAGVVVDGDDFSAGDPAQAWESRSPAENAQRSFDWRRLRRQALEPLLAGRVASWRPFDWPTRSGLAERRTVREPAPVVILAGIYSARPELADLVALSVCVQAPAASMSGTRAGRRRSSTTSPTCARSPGSTCASSTETRPTDPTPAEGPAQPSCREIEARSSKKRG